MKERPIIFMAESVRAILDGKKTQTRRVVKTQPKVELFPFIGTDNKPNGEFAFVDHPRVVSKHLRCPYGVPGDRLWVKETFNIGWLDDNGVLYKANGGSAKACGYTKEPRWKSPLFMPRWASRITLEITDVRVQRVQEISESDAIVEGLPIQMGDGTGPGPGYKWNGPGYFDTVSCGTFGATFHVERDGSCCCKYGREHVINPAVCAYRILWDKINAKRGCSWESNPWVWAVTFKRIIQ